MYYIYILSLRRPWETSELRFDRRNVSTNVEIKLVVSGHQYKAVVTPLSFVV